MKVVYKEPIERTIVRAVQNATKENKTIDHIVLTKAEYSELRTAMERLNLQEFTMPGVEYGAGDIFFYGIRIVLEGRASYGEP